MNFFRKFVHNKKAVGMMTIALSLIGITIGIVVAGSLLPEYITALTNATYTGAPAAVKTMMTTVLGIVIAAAVILLFLKVARR